MTSRSLYEQVLDADYATLPGAVQLFHQLRGQVSLMGQVETEAPAPLLARCLAVCLGAPRGQSQGPLRFELDASPSQEIWTRHFPMRTMRSTLYLVDGEIEEQLGTTRLRFALRAESHRLSMHLKSLRFFGIPCPRGLMPDVIAEERGNGHRFHFQIVASVRFIGRVAAYHGHLDLPQEPLP